MKLSLVSLIRKLELGAVKISRHGNSSRKGLILCLLTAAVHLR